MTENGTESTGVKLTTSVGVNEPVSTLVPLFAGIHVHFATNGVAVVVATASHPGIRTPPAENLTFPAVFAVATMIAGSSPMTVLPPDRTSVEGVAAKGRCSYYCAAEYCKGTC
ncbi:MAG: hypothetical protein WDO06_02525 [Actinomycetota bacterium]